MHAETLNGSGEPHKDDLWPDNDMLMKVTAVALLSTPDLDTTTEVDQTTLFFGPTGTEAAVVGCGAPEDANGDGLRDLSCRFRIQDTGFSDGDELGFVTGFLNNGLMFMGANQVRILHG